MDSPQFEVVTTLAIPKLAYRPSFESITKAFGKILKLIVSVPNVCLQWKDGTCEIPLRQSGDDSEQVELKHFGPRVMQCSRVRDISRTLDARFEA